VSKLILFFVKIAFRLVAIPSCTPATDKIQHHIDEKCCTETPNETTNWLSLRVIRMESELGVASSYPANAFRDQMFGCSRVKERWRVVIALLQN
jgi:hypothetical protein